MVVMAVFREQIRTRLAAAQAQQQSVLQQRARLMQLLDEATAQAQTVQGRIAELTELAAEMDRDDG